MRDLIVLHRYARCDVCGERYHVENDRAKINGRFTNRCIAFHKESDHPSIQIENSIRFHQHEPEVSTQRHDWW